MQEQGLRGKTLFVTGGNTGIGLETAILFARHGADIVLFGIGAELNASSQLRIEALGVGCLAITGDVTNEAEMEAAVARTMACFGGLHYMFNNAGIGTGGLFDEMPWDDVTRIVGINLLGPMIGTRAALPLLRATPGSLCLNNSSSSSIFGTAGIAVY